MAKAGEKSYAALASDLNQGEIRPLYIFYGEESYLKEHYLSTLLNKALDKGFLDFNQSILDGKLITAEAITDAADTLPIGGGRKVLVLKDLNLSKAGDQVRGALMETLADMPEYLSIVLYFDTLEYKPDKRMKVWGEVLARADIIHFDKAERSELMIWLKRRFKALSKEIDNQTCEYMLFYCGHLMQNLIHEVEKIAFGTKGGEITRKDIERLGSKVMEAKIFDLTDYTAKREYKEAYLLLKELFESRVEPIAILSALTRQMQRLYGAFLAQQKGKTTAYLAKQYGLSSEYPAKLLMQNARRFKLPVLRRFIALCAECDDRMKSNLPDDTRTLELLLLRMSVEVEKC